MPSSSAQYTLVGFSPELDWRTLTFLKPIPANPVCSACGLVRKSTALLPCMHVLCECCYEQGDPDGSHLCPIDGSHYEEGDVDLKDFPKDELLRRQLREGRRRPQRAPCKRPASQRGQVLERRKWLPVCDGCFWDHPTFPA
ncbi:hypothetical protein V5799_029707 [Amblyomma americanum]|uniref:RING-type domain-containing protein n=1 Tax=Amblyomma americanum TaxID=6943 RepID=A0AAQ4EQI5_AMBAM